MAQVSKRGAKKTQRRPAQKTTASTGGLPAFSPAFVAEVGACEDVDAFRELLDRKGLWLNRNAAEGVFQYLRSLSGHALGDDELALVAGGANADPSNAAFLSTLEILADQLADRS